MHQVEAPKSTEIKILALSVMAGWFGPTMANAQNQLFCIRVGPAGADAGSAVLGLEDVDRDSAPEVAIGATGDSTAGTRRGSVYVCSTRDGAMLYAIHGDRDEDRFGESLALVPDMDRDGIADFLVGTSIGYNLAGLRSGYVRLHSSADGRLLRRFDGSQADDAFGASVADVGDVDGDGTTDFGVGAPQPSLFGFSAGYAVVLSGASGAVLHRFVGLTARDEFGRAICGLGDVDNDGRADILIGVARSTSQNSSRVTAYSGRTGGALFSIVDSVGSGFGSSLAPLGDVNGDGVRDFAVGATVTGLVVACSVDGRRLWSSGSSGAVRLGRSVCRIGDIDGDGRDDVAAGAPGFSSPTRGRVVLISGRTGALLHELARGIDGDMFGTSVATVGDLDGDSRADLIVGGPGIPARGDACLYAPLQPRFDTYGAGCAGVAGIPRLAATGAARLGQSFQLNIDRLASLRVGVVLFGASDRSWQGMNLPADLTPFGMPGCQLLASAEVMVDVSTQLGATRVTAQVPAEPVLLRARIFHQCLSIDETANALGIVVSNGGITTIGA